MRTRTRPARTPADPAADPASDARPTITGADALSQQVLDAGLGGGDPAAGGDTPPASRTVTIGGREYTVDDELAAALEADQVAQQDIARRMDRLERQPPPSAAAPPSPATPDPPKLTRPKRPSIKLAVDDPEAYDRQMEAYEDQLDLYERQRELGLEERLERRYQTDQSTRSTAATQRAEIDGFVGRLTKKHTFLEGEDDLIQGAFRDVVAAHPNDPLKLTDARTLELVAKAASARLVRYAEKGKGLAPTPPRLEGQHGGAPRTPRQDPAAGPTSIADIQRARRERRRKAHAA